MNKGYRERRESGIPWLGALPAHWKPAKLKYTADIVNGATPDSGNDSYWDGDIVWITPSDLGKLTTAYVSDSKRRISEAGFKSCGTSMVPADTVIMTTRAPIGNSCITTVEACFNQGCKALLLRDGDNKFLYYQLVGYRPYLEMLGSGSTFMELSTDKFKDFVLPVPPLPEQRAIAAYLDHKTAQLDTLLLQKETLLQKLHLKRQALINEVVTQGLDPAAPRKPSGVAWLGDVPAHWGVRRLKTLNTFVTSGSRGWAEYYSDEGEVFLRIGNLSTASIDLKLHNLKRVTPPAGAEGARTSVQENDLLISITALLGAIGIVPKEMQDAYVNQHIALVRLKLDLINPRWAAYFLISAVGQHQFRLLTNGGTKEGLTLGDIASLLLLYPPYAEQQAIVDFIEAKATKIDQAAAAIRTQIQTLKAYRQSLISEVVTGKVDVRPAVLAPEADLPLWQQ